MTPSSLQQQQRHRKVRKSGLQHSNNNIKQSSKRIYKNSSNIKGCFTSLLTLLLGGIIGHFHGRFVSVSNDNNNNNIWLDTTTSMVKYPISNSTSSSSTIHYKQQRAITNITATQFGWRTIHVFHGDTERQLKDSKKHSKKRERQWYSQVKQDFFVMGLFRNKKQGYFIDLASNDAISVSNTLALEMKAQWTGLCIEPNPFYWFSLAFYRRCQLVTAVVGETRMDPIAFSYSGGVGGGIVGEEFDNNSPRAKNSSKLQFTVPLQEIFDRHHVPKVIDYMSLDVEGAEEFIMKHFPFSNYKFSVLTVERPSSGLKTLLSNTGYVLLRNLSRWGETMWAHGSVVPELDLTVFEPYPE